MWGTYLGLVCSRPKFLLACLCALLRQERQELHFPSSQEAWVLCGQGSPWLTSWYEQEQDETPLYVGRAALLECRMLETFGFSGQLWCKVQVSSSSVLAAQLCSLSRRFSAWIVCGVDELFSWLLLFWTVYNTNRSLWLCQKFCTVLITL